MSVGVCKTVIKTDGDSNWQAIATVHHVCSDWPIDEITMRLPKAAIEAIHEHVVKVIADGVKTDVTEEDKAASRSYVARHLYRIELDFVGDSNG
jgi:hypothetical protein